MAENPAERREREPAEHIAGRVLGIGVFLAGIAMLIIAFVLAFQAFHDPDKIIPLGQLDVKPAPNPTKTYLIMFLRLLLLFIMGYLGSLIAARGAHLFFTARREPQRAAGD